MHNWLVCFESWSSCKIQSPFAFPNQVSVYFNNPFLNKTTIPRSFRSFFCPRTPNGRLYQRDDSSMNTTLFQFLFIFSVPNADVDYHTDHYKSFFIRLPTALMFSGWLLFWYLLWVRCLNVGIYQRNKFDGRSSIAAGRWYNQRHGANVSASCFLIEEFWLLGDNL